MIQTAGSIIVEMKDWFNIGEWANCQLNSVRIAEYGNPKCH